MPRWLVAWFAAFAALPAQAPPPLRLALPATAPAVCASSFLVVAVDLPAGLAAAAGYRRAAARAARFHGGALVEWDGRDVDTLVAQVRARTPANILFVLRPATLDVVLHRRLLLALTRLDDDLFADCCFGYLTAADGDGCERFWQRSEALHGAAPLGGDWWQASVCSGERSFTIADAPPPLARAAGFRGAHHYFATGDRSVQQAVARALGSLATAAVAEFTGCGDPQGIWLFSDRRNLQRERHWDYAPERVGHDPDAEMPRLLAARLRAQPLRSAIVWSGTCHSGAVERVFVEADIVATFGRTARATVHRLAPADSLALAWIDAGAAALCVPIAANHGLAVSRETDFALAHGASLGEALKSTWDDVCCAAGGALRLDLPAEGEPHPHGENVMQGGGSNRLLLGDPALRPFRAVGDPRQVVTVAPAAGGFTITVDRAAGFVAAAWDMYGGSQPDDWRVPARVTLPDCVPPTAMALSITATATDPDGAPLPYAVRRAAIEDHDGRRLLHVQANGRRAVVENRAVRVVFRVAVE